MLIELIFRCFPRLDGTHDFNCCASTRQCVSEQISTEEPLRRDDFHRLSSFNLKFSSRQIYEEIIIEKPKLQACTRALDKCVLVIAVRRAAEDQSASSIRHEGPKSHRKCVMIHVMTKHDSGGKFMISRQEESFHPSSPLPPLEALPQPPASHSV